LEIHNRLHLTIRFASAPLREWLRWKRMPNILQGSCAMAVVERIQSTGYALGESPQKSDPTVCPQNRLARKLQRPPSTTNRIAWRYAAPIALLHLLALAACIPWLFSWTGVVLWIVGVYFYGGLGINIAYHRLLTHRSFKCPLWLERCLVTVAICCMEDAPGSWVATHRLHHNDSDEQHDPHSPLVNFFWSHMGWLLIENRDVRCFSAYERFARDVLRDPFYMRLERRMLPLWIYATHAALYFLAGIAANWAGGGTLEQGLQFGLSLLVWGVILRTVCVWHISWSVNSLTHLYGYRSYETNENSRNNWFVALLTSGEGWHNNHHHDPSSASNSHHWWEIDPMFGIIRLLEMCGLATDVIRPRHLRRIG
jgi:fatty-acid desaturase